MDLSEAPDDRTLSNKNAAAVRVALDNQNAKLDAFETQLKNLQRTITVFVDDYNTFKRDSLQDIASKFHGGSTVKE